MRVEGTHLESVAALESQFHSALTHSCPICSNNTVDTAVGGWRVGLFLQRREIFGDPVSSASVDKALHSI